MKPGMHILEISISSLHVIVWPTITPKSADKKCQFLTFKVHFLCQKLFESFYFFSLKNINLGAHILLLAFLKTSIIKALYLVNMSKFFDSWFWSFGCLTMTWFSEETLISNICIRDSMFSAIKKFWKVSNKNNLSMLKWLAYFKFKKLI